MRGLNLRLIRRLAPARMATDRHEGNESWARMAIRYTSQARAAAAVAAAAAGSHLSLWALPSYRHAACMVIGYTSTRMSTAAKPRSNPEKYVVI